MTASALPQRSLDQRKQALVLANRVRAYRCQLKQDIRTGKASFLTVLACPPAECETMRVRDLRLEIAAALRARCQS